MATHGTSPGPYAQTSAEDGNSFMDDNSEIGEDYTPMTITPQENPSNASTQRTRLWGLSVLQTNNIILKLNSPIRVVTKVSRWGRNSRDWIKKSASTLFGKLKECVKIFRKDGSASDETDSILVFPDAAEIDRALGEIDIGHPDSLNCGLGVAPDIPSIFPEAPSRASELELTSLDVVCRSNRYYDRYNLRLNSLQLSTRPATPSTLEAVFGRVEGPSDSDE